MQGERPMGDDEDAELIHRFLRGDAGAFDLLFSRYQDYVYNIVYGIVGRSEEARDLTQDVFIQVYRSLPKFRHGSRFATWVYRIAVNRAVDAARGARRWSFFPIRDEPSMALRTASPDDEPERVAIRSAETASMQQLLMQCSLTHREVLVLRYYRDLSVEEIAETLNCSVSAAKVRLHRARLAFKRLFEAANGTGERERDAIPAGR